MTRAGKLVQHGLESDLYPQRSGNINVETHIIFEADGMLFQGYVDLMWRNKSANPVICDHKTSSDPAKYAIPSGMLADDVQATIYATWGLSFFETDSLKLWWVYHQTASRVKPKVFARGAEVGHEETEERFRLNILPTAHDIRRARATCKTGNELNPNPEACGDFGGCPFSDFCTLNREQKLAAVFGKEDTNMPTLRELLKQKGKLPPPRVNSPEHKAGVEAAKETSKAVGQATGNAKRKNETAREIANSVAGETDPAVVKEKAETALHGAEQNNEARKAPSMTQQQILIALRDGDRSNGIAITCSKPKATAEIPYVAGRTLSSLVKNKLVTSRDTEDGTKRLMLTGLGLDKIGTQSVNRSLETDTTAPLNPTPTPEITEAAESVGVPKETITRAREAAEKNVVHLAAANGPSKSTPAAAPEHAEFFRELLREHCATEAKDRFDAYCSRFPLPTE
jgi:hypothetical protein